MFEPSRTPDSSTSPPREPAAPHTARGGWWVGLVALVAVACCALPPLLAAGVFAGLAGIGVGGLAGGLVGIAVVIVAAVLWVRRRRRGSGCAVHGPACGKECERS